MDTVTLGLSFSTRMFGLAVFKSNSLIDYSVKLHKEMWSEDKRDSILASLASCIKHYTISSIALSTPEAHCRTKAFKELRNAIEAFAHLHEIPVVSYQTKEIFRAFGSPILYTRMLLMKRLIMLYPELSQYYDREMANKNKYYIKLFEAVGVGAHHWLECNK
jgi:hypothetical protein